MRPTLLSSHVLRTGTVARQHVDNLSGARQTMPMTIPPQLFRVLATAAVVGLLAGCSVTITVDDGTGVTPESTEPIFLATPPTIPAAVDAAVACSATVAPGDDLQGAVDAAGPSDVICLATGQYVLDETLAITTSGEDDNPITLRSAPGEAAVVDGPDGDPAIELTGAAWWSLTDLEVTGGDILLRLNRSTDNEFRRSVFHDAGGECVRIRDQSQRNRFSDNVVYACGVEGFTGEEGHKNGEGVYVGTAPEQRDRIGGVADHSDENALERNWFRTDGSEAIDIKEDSERNVVRDNVGLGSRDPDGAIFDSRGDRNEFLYNEAFAGAGAGFRTGGDEVDAGQNGQRAARVYGADNVFRGNDAHDNAGYGYRFMVWPQDIDCTNTSSGDAKGAFYVDDEDVALSCAGESASPAAVPATPEPGDGVASPEAATSGVGSERGRRRT